MHLYLVERRCDVKGTSEIAAIEVEYGCSVVNWIYFFNHALSRIVMRYVVCKNDNRLCRQDREKKKVRTVGGVFLAEIICVSLFVRKVASFKV